MANFNEIKTQSITKGLTDTQLLIKSGLMPHVDAIAEKIYNEKVNKRNDKSVYIAIIDIKKRYEKTEFLAFFVGYEAIAEAIWLSEDFDAIIGALCRKITKIILAKDATYSEKKNRAYLIEDTSLVSQDIPFGKFSVASEYEVSVYKDKSSDITSLKAFKYLIGQTSGFANIYSNYGENLLQEVGVPENILYERYRSYFNVLLPVYGMDMETKGGYIANVNSGGVFYIPMSPFTFQDSKIQPFFGKSFNVVEDAYPEQDDVNPDDVFLAETERVRAAYKKYADDNYWDLAIGAFNPTQLIDLINGSVQMSSHTLSAKYKFPVEINIPDKEGNNYKFVFANTDLLHFVSEVYKISKSNDIVVKANIVNKELIFISDLSTLNADNKSVSAFALLSPLNTQVDDFLDSYLGVDFREFKATAVIRERERIAKKVFDFSKISRSLVESVKAKRTAAIPTIVPTEGGVAVVAEVAVKPQIVVEKSLQALADDYSPEFYLAFITSVNEHVSSYTKLEEFVDKTSGAKKIVRITTVDDFKKDSTGEYILKDGQKIKDFNYVYSNREAFWVNNGEFKIEELIAFFVSRGADANYRKLSKEILGYDCFEYEENLIDDLIKSGYLAIDDIEIDYANKKVKRIKYSYYADYANGGYYEKIEKLRGAVTIEGGDKSGKKTKFSDDIINYFGFELGTDIIEKQSELLDAHRNIPLTFLIENETKKNNQLEIGVENAVIWDNPKFLNVGNWKFTDTHNPRMPIMSKSNILSAFYEWIKKNNKNPSLLEFKDDIQELFDAAVVPLDSVSYIERYILPNWLVKMKRPDGKEEQKLHPINLPAFTYSISRKSVNRKIRFSTEDLKRWNGDDYYKKDMRPETGVMKKYVYRGKETDLEFFKFNNNPEGIKARKEWEYVIKELSKAVIDPFNKRKSKATKVCNYMFNLYLQKNYPADKRIEIEEYWNKKYNSYMLPKYERYPIFARHAKYFAKSEQPFAFAPVQLEGQRTYISRENSVTLGHEIGFGKTTSAVGSISHMFNTGESNRVLLCVPNIVYDKWKREILGNETFKGLLPFVNIVDLFNSSGSALEKLKVFTKEEKEVIKKFKLFKEDYDVFIKLLQNKKLDIHKNVPSEIVSILEKFIPDYDKYNALSDFKSETEYWFSELKKNLIDSIQDERDRLTKKAERARKKLADEADNDVEEARILNEPIVIDEDYMVRFVEKRAAEINKELTSECTNVVLFRVDSLVDDLGYYKAEVRRDRSIILCTHDAIGKLRGSLRGGMDALAIIDDAFEEVQPFIPASEPTTSVERLSYINRFRIFAPLSNATKLNRKVNPFKLPVSLEKLNVDAFVIDEIQEFNTIVTNIRKRKVVGRENPRTREKFEFGKDAIGSSAGKDKAVLQYFSHGHGTRTIMSVNCLAIARSIQTKNRAEKKRDNTLLLSATPFTDSPIFQMVSVFAIQNYELMRKINMSSTWDVFNQYASEEWKLDLTHDGRIGNFPTVDKYKNIYANSNLLNLFVNFKISDAEVEKLRPNKYTFPDQKGLFKDILPDVPQLNSYVPQNRYQIDAKTKILAFMHDEIGFKELFSNDLKIAKAQKEEENEETVMNIADEMAMLSTKDIEIGQKVKRLDTNTYWELINVDPSTITSWYEIGATIDAKADEIAENISVDDEDQSDDQVAEINVEGGDIELSLEKGNLSKEDMAKGKTIVAMGADMNISVSPYFANISLGLPALSEFDSKTKKTVYFAKNFVETSPKLWYIAECIKTVIDWHKSHNQRVSGQIIYLNRDSFYFEGVKYRPLDLLKQYLAERTDIDATSDQIGIIRGSTTRIQRQEIQDGFNSGKYRILIGTAAIKQGVDLQVNTSVMHIAMADYLPSTIMQLEGRGWRQGNQWENIRISYVMTYGSLDGFQFSKVSQKISTIKKMLESSVFNMNETQFDKDFNEMKLELETNIKKKAELKYEMEEDKIKDEFTKAETLYNSLKNIKENYPKYKEDYETYINRLNTIGQELEQIAFDEVKEDYINILRNRLGEAQRAKQIGIIEKENARIDSENKDYADKLESEITTLQKAVVVTKEAGIAAPAEEKKALSDKLKDIEVALKEKESAAKKPLVNKTKRDEILADIARGLREVFAKERADVTVSNEDVMKYAERLGDNIFRFKHAPLTTKSSYSDIHNQLNKIKDYSRRAFGIGKIEIQQDVNTMLPEEREKYLASGSISGFNPSRRKRTAFVNAGYEEGFNTGNLYLDTYGKRSERGAYQKANDEFDHFIAESESFDFKSIKGSIIKEFVEQVGDEKLMDEMIQHAEAKRNELNAILNNRDEEINKLIEVLEKQEEIKKTQGSYDMAEQVKKFDRTNVLLTLRPTN